MRTKLLTMTCLLLFLMTGCGDDGAVSNLFIPDFSNNWESSRLTVFQFKPDALNVNKGNFNGDEDGSLFTGSFNSYDINFTFSSGSEAGTTYSGKFVKDSKPLQMIVKKPGGADLTIKKF
ncbi:MAG: hypothetical protein H7096_10535 [Flavobacterium sp.]|nr:hypothetical protein [Pedobacter sp.]